MRKIVLLMFFLGSLVMSTNQLFAQGKSISGTVIGDDDNAPLRDVTVTVKGTRVATKTNTAGYFSIAASKGQVLVFTYID